MTIDKKLRIIFWAGLATVAFLVAAFESLDEAEGFLVMDSRWEFGIQTVAELVTIVAIPTALRLFKTKRMRARLVTCGTKGMLGLALLRLSLLQLLIIMNTLLYYGTLSTAFGYMAIILLLCLPFVYPSRARCEEETGEERP